jgi:hypothetical protein
VATDNLYGHTGRELELMSAGGKPLAMFYEDADTSDEDSSIPYSQFEPHVSSGRFAKGMEIYEGSIDPRNGRLQRVKYVLYALKTEQWRIPAMFLVIRTTLRTKVLPDEGLLRMESALLGYSDAEIDAYIARWRASVNIPTGD